MINMFFDTCWVHCCMVKITLGRMSFLVSPVGHLCASKQSSLKRLTSGRAHLYAVKTMLRTSRKSRPPQPPTDPKLPSVSTISAVTVAPAQGTKRKSIFSESLDDLCEVDESIKKKPFSSFSKVPTNFDGSKYSFNFSVEPNRSTATMSTDYDLFDLDDITLTSTERSKQENGRLIENGKLPENGVTKAPERNKHEDFDDLMNDSFDDMMCDFQNSPDAVLKPEGFRTATGTLIDISDERRERAMQRFQDLADLSKEVAGFIWHHRRQLL